MERRAFEVSELRIESAEGKATRMSGYAAVFGQSSVPLSDNMGSFIEQIQPGAFSGALADDVRALLNHNPDIVLGRTGRPGAPGTLRLFVDQRGLGFDLELPDTTPGRDLAVSVKRGDISGMSFAFKVPKGGEAWARSAGVRTRTLKEVRLVDISPCTFPAYPGTEVSMRAADVADAAASLRTVLEAEAEERLQAQARANARERSIRIRERELGLQARGKTEDELRALAMGRVMAGVQKREQTLEDRMSAIYRALRKLLGSPYESETNYWYLWATYEDKVIVERVGIVKTLHLYPMSFDAQGVPTFGAPVQVEVQYMPVKVKKGAAAA
jgi:HK97 family phage prohead protease